METSKVSTLGKMGEASDVLEGENQWRKYWN